MFLSSEVTGKLYEVKTYQMTDARGISHDSLQDILENQLMEDGVTYEIDILAASEKYCAVKCTITGKNGRKIYRVNDVNVEDVTSRDPSQQNFAQEHPLIAATNSAVDNAVKAYLKFPKVIPNDEFEPLEDVTEDKNTEMEHKETVMDSDVEETLEKSLAEKIAELGQVMAPPSSKYKDKTLAEIWEINQGWFNYIKNSNRSDTYIVAREFAKLKEMEKEQP